MAIPPPPPQVPGPYGPQQAAGQPYGAAYGAYGSHPLPGRYACVLCGAWPAAPATVRGHQGLIVLMRFLSRRGPFCRDCGLATYREMSSDTLWQGWWSPLSLIAAPVTLLMNLGPRAAFRRLAPPASGLRPALDPGRPLWRRAPALLVLVPVALVALAVPTLIVLGLLAGGGEPTRLSVGQCVRDVAEGSGQTLLVEPCNSPDAEYRVTRHLGPGTTCADGELYAYPEYGPGGTTTSCLARLR